MELRARSQTSSAIRALLGLAPKSAKRLDDKGGEADVPLDQVQVGDRLRVRRGEKVPVDGTVLEGHSSIDKSMISGEPIPVEKDKGAKVTAGTVNGTGGFVMRAERVGADTLLSQIVKMVSEAQRSRAPIPTTRKCNTNNIVCAALDNECRFLPRIACLEEVQFWRSQLALVQVEIRALG
jgi:Cu+-exporting ATPase